MNELNQNETGTKTEIKHALIEKILKYRDETLSKILDLTMTGEDEPMQKEIYLESMVMSLNARLNNQVLKSEDRLNLLIMLQATILMIAESLQMRITAGLGEEFPKKDEK
jgi:hypothetical protein